MTKKLTTCPTCHGEGLVSGCVKPGPGGTMKPTKKACPDCDGDGEVEVTVSRRPT